MERTGRYWNKTFQIRKGASKEREWLCGGTETYRAIGGVTSLLESRYCTGEFTLLLS